MTPLFLAMLLTAADPAAMSAQSGAPAQAAKPAKDPNKLICRHEEQIGTNIKVKKCMTQADWEKQEEAVRQYFDDAQANGSVHTARVSSGAPGG